MAPRWKARRSWRVPCTAIAFFGLSLAATTSRGPSLQASPAIIDRPIPAEQDTMFEQLADVPSAQPPSNVEAARNVVQSNSLSSPDSLHEHVNGAIDDYGLDGQVSAILAASNALAYVHLLYTTSRSRSYIMEIIQIIAFACFPTLPLVQLISNASKTFSDFFRNRNSGLFYHLNCLGGQYVFHVDEQPSLLEPRKRLVEVPLQDLEMRRKPRTTLSWVSKMLLVLSNLAAALVSLIIYIERPMRSDWETAAIGQDQRLGWAALGGTIAALLTFLVHACAVRWTLHPTFFPEEPVSLLWESEVFTEIVFAALLQDAVIAYAGGISLVGVISVFAANRLVLVILFLGFVLFNRQLRYFAKSVFGSRYKKRWTAVRPLAVVFSLATCASILLFQVLTAFMEHRAVSRLS